MGLPSYPYRFNGINLNICSSPLRSRCLIGVHEGKQTFESYMSNQMLIRT